MIDVNLIGAPAYSVARVGDGFVFTGYNRRMAELTGLEGRHVVGSHPSQCFSTAAAEAAAALYRRCLDERQAIESEAYHVLPGGGRWWSVALTPVLDRNGEASSLVAVAADVTDRKAAERQQREAEARMALALDVLHGGFWQFDIAGGGVEVTAKLADRVAGRGGGRMGWDDFVANIRPGGDPGVRDLGPMVRGAVEAATVEYVVDDPRSGETRWFRSRRRLIRDAFGAPERIMGAVLDVTEQRRLEETYASLARTDALTGLCNRRGFEAGAARLLREPGRRHFGLIVLDLDRFKAINDVHGHATGDVVLREIAARLRRAVRPGDVVARLGGDEFAILVEDADGCALPYLAQRFVLEAQRPVATPEGEVTVGVSIGVARSAGGDVAIAEVASRADRALYDVKRAGRGAWKFAA